MSKRFLISVATAALIAGSGFANAQGTGPAGGNGGAAMQGSPSAAPTERGGAMTRDDAAPARGAEPGMKSSQSDEKMAPGAKRSAQDSAPGQKGKMNAETRDSGKMDKDMKAEDGAKGRTAAESKTGEKSNATTGQAAAGGKLSTEQRTKITSVIRERHIQPQTNINFSVSVGTRVPRDVRFYPLPTEIVTVYPDWRGYEFFLVNDQIIVVNPRTMEIVALLDA